MFTIGKLARGAEVSTETVRYYEKQGLLSPARKTGAGYRLYDTQALQRLRFIRQAQRAGFSLAEIRDLLALKISNAACCSDVRSLAIGKKLQLEHKIKALREMSLALGGLIERCDDDALPLGLCPILTTLEASLIRQAPVAEHA